MAKKKDTEQKAPAPGPAPSAEEMRRRHVEDNAKDRLGHLRNDLEELRAGDLKKSDRLRALEQVGEKILELALQTRGRLRSAEGRGDAFLEGTAANVLSGLRHAAKVMEMHDREMQSWPDSLELLKPVVKDLQRIAEGLERPGIKTAIVPGGGEGLFNDEGQPTEKAAAQPAAPAQSPQAAPEPEAQQQPQPAAPAQAHVVGREIQTLGMGPVIDVEPEPEPTAHPFDGLEEDAINDLVSLTIDKLEEAGVEEGLKRKDWKKHYDAWCAILPFVSGPDDEDFPGVKQAFTLLLFALETRKPISWAVPTEAEVNDHARKLAIAAGE